MNSLSLIRAGVLRNKKVVSATLSLSQIQIYILSNQLAIEPSGCPERARKHGPERVKTVAIFLPD